MTSHGITQAGRPWLTVVLPTHNGEQWIGATLDSLSGQADAGVEVLIVDTSDSDATLAIVATYADRLALRVIEPDHVAGCSAKMNFGVAEARADHVSWLCQDDLWLPGRTAAVRRWIEEDATAALHLAPSAIVDAAGQRLGTWNCPLAATERRLDPAEVVELLIVQNFVSVVSPVVRRDAWLACGGIDLALWYSGDWDLWLKLARSGPVRYHDEVTGAFRIHGQSATSQGSRDAGDFRRQLEQVVERHLLAIPGPKRARARRLAYASVAVNCGLAAAAAEDRHGLFRAGRAVLGLGPLAALRYVRASRIHERVLPRVRARLAGAL